MPLTPLNSPKHFSLLPPNNNLIGTLTPPLHPLSQPSTYNGTNHVTINNSGTFPLFIQYRTPSNTHTVLILPPTIKSQFLLMLSITKGFKDKLSHPRGRGSSGPSLILPASTSLEPQFLTGASFAPEHIISPIDIFRIMKKLIGNDAGEKKYCGPQVVHEFYFAPRSDILVLRVKFIFEINQICPVLSENASHRKQARLTVVDHCRPPPSASSQYSRTPHPSAATTTTLQPPLSPASGHHRCRPRALDSIAATLRPYHRHPPTTTTAGHNRHPPVTTVVSIADQPPHDIHPCFDRI
ncbi:hypothetical protein M5K25_016384 [Dendrobium thyrsiflorum]|uniref:Uncharacterized protein n=1 Tax=Dendrobium thyrsiflorum TaxID=117978 RepID=A0ABD0UJW9_DENTH